MVGVMSAGKRTSFVNQYTLKIDIFLLNIMP
jgi:hypothetical protein